MIAALHDSSGMPITSRSRHLKWRWPCRRRDGKPCHGARAVSRHLCNLRTWQTQSMILEVLKRSLKCCCQRPETL